MSRYMTVLVRQLVIAERSIARLSTTIALKEDYRALLERSGITDRAEDIAVVMMAEELQRWQAVKEHIHRVIGLGAPE